jgi:hypothetical protein
MFAEKNLSMRRLIPILVMVPIWAFATGCYSGTKWKSGKYEVYWIDHSSDLTLGLELEDGDEMGTDKLLLHFILIRMQMNELASASIEPIIPV